MTTLNFKDELTEDPFSISNGFYYSELQSFGLYFQEDSKNYPYILKGEISDKVDLQYSDNPNQLRRRLLNTKKIKEVMDSARVPIRVILKGKWYYLGKGFLASSRAETKELLFIACVDANKQYLTMEDVNFFVSKKIYEDEHKPLQPAIKDLIGAHPGDVTVCNNILDYVGERITMPQGGTIASRKRYQDALVRATIMQIVPQVATAPIITATAGEFEVSFSPSIHDDLPY